MKEDLNPFLTQKKLLKQKNTGIDVNELANKKSGKELFLFIVCRILRAHRFSQHHFFDLQEE
jgi:hypothetical protein